MRTLTHVYGHARLQAMSDMTRLTVVLSASQRARLESLAARRFARRTSATFLYSLELADLVLSDPATIAAETAEQALSAFVAAHVQARLEDGEGAARRRGARDG